ncbi:MAG: hypothetical protein ABIJ09_16175 [Pseudomonadota bacterium]
MRHIKGIGLVLTTALFLCGCPSKEAKLDGLKQQCLGFCAKRDKVVELCQAYCKESGSADCESVYCAQPKENVRECGMCCEEKGSKQGFVLGSCLGQADMSETVTPEKMWEIGKKIAGERLKGEEKEKVAKLQAEHLQAIQAGGWSLTDEKDEESGAVAVMGVKEATAELAGGDGPAKPKLLLRCSGGNAELYVQTVLPVKNSGGKLTGKVKIDDEAAQAWGLNLAADQDTLLFEGSAGLLKALAGKSVLDFEFHAKSGGATHISFTLGGLREILELHGKSCGAE